MNVVLLKVGIAFTFSTLFHQIFNGFTGDIYVLLIFIIMDYISGLCKAIYQKKLDSEIGFKGIIKKITILFMVFVMGLLDYYMHSENQYILRTGFFITNEIISIIENVGLIIPLPAFLMDIINKLKKGGE